MKRICNTINKNFIVSNLNQVSIFSRYLQIEEDIIEKCIDKGSLISSPLRDTDKHGSVGFKYNSKGMLKMRDFGGFFWGDCFDMVATILNANGYNININSKDGFKFVLNTIANEFDIANGVDESPKYNTDLLKVVKTTKKTITFTIRHWNNSDKKYWVSQYDNIFTIDYLTKNHVYPVELYWIDSSNNPEPKYYYTRKDPCYAYYIGTDEDGLVNINLYFPNRVNSEYPKFIKNNNSFQGLFNIKDSYDYIILTKSYKDVLALKALLPHLCLQGNQEVLILAYPSENYSLTDEIFEWLFDKLNEKNIDNIINFLDFDRTGRKTSKYCNDIYGIPYVFITNGELGLPNHQAKDITDFIAKYGKKDTITIINQFIINYGNKYFDSTSDYMEYDSPF